MNEFKDLTKHSIIAERAEEHSVISVRALWVLIFVAVSFAVGFILGIIAGGK